MKIHDLLVAALVIGFFVLLSLPATFGFGYWAESAAAWTAYVVGGALLAGYVLYSFVQNLRRVLRHEGPDAGDAAEMRRRNVAMGILGLMAVLWIGLGALSFMGGRTRPDPDQIRVQAQTATQGKRVFQAYNCMGCHTIVGNGAYFAPDLTKIYGQVGPAWLMAFLGSAGTWPTATVVDLWVDRLKQAGELDVASPAQYYERYPQAKSRTAERGGHATLMPNLAFSADDRLSLVAFMKYASAVDTAGWPPAVRAEPRVVDRMRADLRGATLPIVAAAPALPTPAVSPSGEHAADGKEIANKMGCIACHSTDGTAKVGPTWKGLFNSSVPLNDGRVVLADEAYLRESILEPDAKVVKGFQPQIMPAYTGRLSPQELDALIAYVRHPD